MEGAGTRKSVKMEDYLTNLTRRAAEGVLVKAVLGKLNGVRASGSRDGLRRSEGLSAVKSFGQ